jgi:hypothetical protein
MCTDVERLAYMGLSVLDARATQLSAKLFAEPVLPSSCCTSQSANIQSTGTVRDLFQYSSSTEFETAKKGRYALFYTCRPTSCNICWVPTSTTNPHVSGQQAGSSMHGLALCVALRTPCKICTTLQHCSDSTAPKEALLHN